MTDEDLIAYLREYPMRSLAQICERFAVPYQYTPAQPGPSGQTYGYTEELKAVRNQLQRLRRARLIRSEGMRWVVR